MNNIDRIKEYIQDAVISPLERLMNGDSGEPSVSLYEKYLHAMMVPYYEMYLNGDIRLCCAGNRLEFVGRKMESIIEDDDQFGNWASEKNLITAAENWGDNLKRSFMCWRCCWSPIASKIGVLCLGNLRRCFSSRRCATTTRPMRCCVCCTPSR